MVVKGKKSFLEWRDSLGRVRRQALDPEFQGFELYDVQVIDPVDHIWWTWQVGKDSPHQTIKAKYKFRNEYVQWPTDFKFGSFVQPEGPGWKDVRLQPIWVNGVYATGDRYTQVFLPGQSGNNTNHPVTTVSEDWVSVDLGEIVKSRHTNVDGSKEMEDLFVFDRLEPDPTLFEPPAGNEILEAKPFGDAVDESTTQEPSHPAQQSGLKAPANAMIVTISPAGTTVTPGHTAPPEH
jgi:hypothetical protein